MKVEGKRCVLRKAVFYFASEFFENNKRSLVIIYDLAAAFWLSFLFHLGYLGLLIQKN